MNVESITNLARHIWSSIVPPFLNLLFLGIILGDTIVRQIDKAAVAGLSNEYATRGINFLSDLFRSVISLFSFVDLNQLLSKSINVQSLSSVSISLLLFVTLVFLIFVYFIDNLTKMVSQLLRFCFHSWQAQSVVRAATGQLAKVLARRGDERYTARVRRLEDFVHLRAENQDHLAYARASLFSHAAQAPVPTADIQKAVVAWLFQNVKAGRWESDRQALSDQLKSLVAWEDYLRVYLTVTLVYLLISVFELFRHGIPILLIVVLLLAKGVITIAVLHARRRLISRDLEEFYFYNIAAAPHPAAA